MLSVFAPFDPPAFLSLLAHELRWSLLEILAAGDRRVQELVAQLDKPQNLVSYHLRRLRDAGLVHERRSSLDARDVYYSLDLERLQTLYSVAGESLHPALCRSAPRVRDRPGNGEGQAPARVLFLCTHNSARSQLAEGILRANAGDRVEVLSAGSEAGKVHPMAVRAAAALQIDISRQRSKHMDELAGQAFDYVITVCDRVREVCPVLPEDRIQIHWSIPDPAEVTGSEEQQYQAFLHTARALSTRIGYLLMVIERRQTQLSAEMR